MGRGHGQEAKQGQRPRNTLEISYRCEACGSPSTFDGNSGEWCPRCQTELHLQREEALYRLVEVDLDLSQA